jgi:hypothetical protein
MPSGSAGSPVADDQDRSPQTGPASCIRAVVIGQDRPVSTPQSQSTSPSLAILSPTSPKPTALNPTPTTPHVARWQPVKGRPGRGHRGGRTRRLVEKMAAIRQGNHVFPGGKAERPISNMAMLMLLRRMGWGDLTTHGFRSTFRDWAAECTNFPAEVAEMALAHTVGDKLEAAYRRGDLFEKRREIMAGWANFIDRDKAATVVPMRKGG